MSVLEIPTVIVMEKPGNLANREDAVATSILNKMFDQLLEHGVVLVLDPNEALQSRVKHPGYNLTDRLKGWMVSHVGEKTPRHEVFSWMEAQGFFCSVSPMYSAPMEAGPQITDSLTHTQVLWQSPSKHVLSAMWKLDHPETL